MNRKSTALIVLIAVVQLAVPAVMIRARERTLREGQSFRFACEPVDPYDAFRGRYIRIAVDTQRVPWTDHEPNTRRSRAMYAILETGGDGYARVASVTNRRPSDAAFVRAKIWALDPASGEAQVRLPIDRFYLPDHEAPEAERAYMRSLSGGSRAADVVVRVRNGDLVVEDLLIEGTPIRVFLRRPPPDSPEAFEGAR